VPESELPVSQAVHLEAAIAEPPADACVLLPILRELQVALLVVVR